MKYYTSYFYVYSLLRVTSSQKPESHAHALLCLENIDLLKNSSFN